MVGGQGEDVGEAAAGAEDDLAARVCIERHIDADEAVGGDIQFHGYFDFLAGLDGCVYIVSAVADLGGALSSVRRSQREVLSRVHTADRIYGHVA